MAKKVTKKPVNDYNPITDENAKTKYANESHENPMEDEKAVHTYKKDASENVLTDTNAHTRYANKVDHNLLTDDISHTKYVKTSSGLSSYEEIEYLLKALSKIIKDQFPNATDDARISLINNILNKYFVK